MPITWKGRDLRNNKRITTVAESFTHNATGEKVTLVGTRETVESYYKIRKLNVRINMKSFLEVQEDICGSKKDLRAFRLILDKVNASNNVMKVSPSDIAQEGITSQKVGNILRSMHKHKLCAKLQRSAYFFNPYLVTGKFAKSRNLELMQQAWTEYIDEDNMRPNDKLTGAELLLLLVEGWSK